MNHNDHNALNERRYRTKPRALNLDFFAFMLLLLVVPAELVVVNRT